MTRRLSSSKLPGFTTEGFELAMSSINGDAPIWSHVWLSGCFYPAACLWPMHRIQTVRQFFRDVVPGLKEHVKGRRKHPGKNLGIFHFWTQYTQSSSAECRSAEWPFLQSKVRDMLFQISHIFPVCRIPEGHSTDPIDFWGNVGRMQREKWPKSSPVPVTQFRQCPAGVKLLIPCYLPKNHSNWI